NKSRLGTVLRRLNGSLFRNSDRAPASWRSPNLFASIGVDSRFDLFDFVISRVGRGVPAAPSHSTKRRGGDTAPYHYQLPTTSYQLSTTLLKTLSLQYSTNPQLTREVSQELLATLFAPFYELTICNIYPPNPASQTGHYFTQLAEVL